MTYNGYIADMADATDGWCLLAIPIIGWFFAVICFGFYFPFRYIWDKGIYR